jgi:hypothetical protein
MFEFLKGRRIIARSCIIPVFGYFGVKLLPVHKHEYTQQFFKLTKYLLFRQTISSVILGLTVPFGFVFITQGVTSSQIFSLSELFQIIQPSLICVSILSSVGFILIRINSLFISFFSKETLKACFLNLFLKINGFFVLLSPVIYLFLNSLNDANGVAINSNLFISQSRLRLSSIATYIITYIGFGNYFTKFADIRGDFHAKIATSLGEDNPENPFAIFDNIGDVLGDQIGRANRLVGRGLSLITFGNIGLHAESFSSFLFFILKILSINVVRGVALFYFFPIYTNPFGVLGSVFTGISRVLYYYDVPLLTLASYAGVPLLLSIFYTHKSFLPTLAFNFYTKLYLPHPILSFLISWGLCIVGRGSLYALPIFVTSTSLRPYTLSLSVFFIVLPAILYFDASGPLRDITNGFLRMTGQEEMPVLGHLDIRGNTIKAFTKLVLSVFLFASFNSKVTGVSYAFSISKFIFSPFVLVLGMALLLLAGIYNTVNGDWGWIGLKIVTYSQLFSAVFFFSSLGYTLYSGVDVNILLFSIILEASANLQGAFADNTKKNFENTPFKTENKPEYLYRVKQDLIGDVTKDFISPLLFSLLFFILAVKIKAFPFIKLLIK